MGEPQMFVHSISETGRLLPSASRWNSIEIDYGYTLPASFNLYDSIPSKYSKSFEFSLSIANRARFKRFLYISAALIILAVAGALLVSFIPRKLNGQGPSLDLTLALDQALLFFDAQKSGILPKDNPVKFRGDSATQDGKQGRGDQADLEGGFYDSGNNIKFSFSTAYTITLLSWSVIEYHEKYEAVGQLDHVKDIIRWGSDYLLKVIGSSLSKSIVLYSQVGGRDSANANSDNDITCWQKPEDMDYPRPVSTCESSATDLAAEVAAALAASSLVFGQEEDYAKRLIRASENLFNSAEKNPHKHVYTANGSCGGEASNYYNSTSYYDELVWGGTWLFFATGNFTYLQYATETLGHAVAEEAPGDTAVFYWNNKLAANAVLLTRLWYLHDPGYPYDGALKNCSDMTVKLMKLYMPRQDGYNFNRSPGGLILLKPNSGAPLQYAANAAFLSKIFSDYLNIIKIGGGDEFSREMLRNFAKSQVNYILGLNPLKLSYLVGFGDKFPQQVHHRGASIPWNGKHYSCADGERWRYSKDSNPNVLVGAMVAGPDRDDKFLDERNWPLHTEPTLSGNAGLVAALVALLDDDHNSLIIYGGMDRDGIFANIARINVPP